MDIAEEITFKTARSGGSGGQNVNKVETMVEGYWHIQSSSLFAQDQKERLLVKLANRINANGYLLVKSQEARTQLANKKLVVAKINALGKAALVVPKKRKATKPGKAAIEKRLTGKKNKAEKKETRKKINL
jgi:ribosome-associated protein